MMLEAIMHKLSGMVPIITQIDHPFHYELPIHYPKDYQVLKGNLAFGKKCFFVLEQRRSIHGKIRNEDHMALRETWKQAFQILIAKSLPMVDPLVKEKRLDNRHQVILEELSPGSYYPLLD